MPDNPVMRTQRIILTLLQGGVSLAFVALAVQRFWVGEVAVGAVCVGGAAYAGYRTWQVWKSGRGS